MNKKIFAISLAVGMLLLGMSAFGQDIKQALVVNLLGEPFYTSNAGVVEVELLNGYKAILTIPDSQEIAIGMSVKINALNATGTKVLYEDSIWDPNAISCKLTELPQEVVVLDGPRVDFDGYTWYKVQDETCSGWAVERFGAAIILEPFSAQEILEKLNPPTATWTSTPTATYTQTSTATFTATPSPTPTMAEPDPKIIGYATTTVENLRLRISPDIFSAVVRTLPLGAQLEIYNNPPDGPDAEGFYWLRVKTTDSVFGYVASNYVEHHLNESNNSDPTPTPEY